MNNGVGAIIQNTSATNSVLTVNGSATTTFNGLLQNGGSGTLALVKSGSGTQSIFGTNTYTGNTTITGGKLAVNSTLASTAINVGSGATLDTTAAGSSFAIGSGKTLLGLGTVVGNVAVNSAGTISPGDPAVNSGIGTLTIGGLTVNSSSSLNFDLSSPSLGDLINVTNNNGLTINGLAGSVNVNLFQPNTSTPFTTTGTYDLFQYVGTLNGTGISALNDLNAPGTTSAVFGTTTVGGIQYVTVTLAPATSSTPTWALAGGGSWNVAADWTPATVPSGQGAKAILGASITAPSTITLDANQIVGSLTFSNTNTYTVAASGAASRSSSTMVPVRHKCRRRWAAM